MRNYRRQQKLESLPTPPDIENESEESYEETITRLDHPFTLSPDRWGKDPFQSFPIAMEPHMQSLVDACEFTNLYSLT
jgi:hypothetical protein